MGIHDFLELVDVLLRFGDERIHEAFGNQRARCGRGVHVAQRGQRENFVVIDAGQGVCVEGDVLDLVEHLGVVDVPMLKPHQDDQGLGAAVLVLVLPVQPGVRMIGGKEVVELGPDLRLRSPVRHKQRYS